jgi:hypothetical protein
VGVALAALLLTASTVAHHAYQHGGTYADKTETVLLAGVAGLLTYLLVGGLSGYFEDRLEEDEEAEAEAEEAAHRGGREPGAVSAVGVGGKAAFFLFLYLEVLDASFSFDGVIGAFAITNDIFWMALGLGIGAMYVRSVTVYLVRQGTLDEYRYLEHGAHYAIGLLAVILLISIRWHIHEVITGLSGVALIGASFWSSLRANKADRAAAGGDEAEKPAVTSGV